MGRSRTSSSSSREGEIPAASGEAHEKGLVSGAWPGLARVVVGADCVGHASVRRQ